MTTLYVLIAAILAVVCALLIVVVSMLNKVAKEVGDVKPVVISNETEKPKAETPKKAVQKKAVQKKAVRKKSVKRKAKDIPSVYGEIWEDVIDMSPNREREIAPIYKVSNMGRVWNAKRGIMLSPFMTKNGYSIVVRTKDGEQTQRLLKVLVACTFIGVKSTGKYKVVHCDNNIKNCAASNLRWAPKNTRKGRRL